MLASNCSVFFTVATPPGKFANPPGASQQTWENGDNIPETEGLQASLSFLTGQIIAEVLASDYYCHYDAESGVSSEDECGKPPRKLEVDTSGGKDSFPLAYDLALGAPRMNLVVDKTAAINSNKESQQLVQETYTLEKKGAKEEDEGPQHRDADIVQGKRGGSPVGRSRSCSRGSLEGMEANSRAVRVGRRVYRKRGDPSRHRKGGRDSSRSRRGQKGG
ncbi:hypothetical protein H8959_005629 [Pygathrix nigripes]